MVCFSLKPSLCWTVSVARDCKQTQTTPRTQTRNLLLCFHENRLISDRAGNREDTGTAHVYPRLQPWPWSAACKGLGILFNSVKKEQKSARESNKESKEINQLSPCIWNSYKRQIVHHPQSILHIFYTAAAAARHRMCISCDLALCGLITIFPLKHSCLPLAFCVLSIISGPHLEAVHLRRRAVPSINPSRNFCGGAATVLCCGRRERNTIP